VQRNVRSITLAFSNQPSERVSYNLNNQPCVQVAVYIVSGGPLIWARVDVVTEGCPQSFGSTAVILVNRGFLGLFGQNGQNGQLGQNSLFGQNGPNGLFGRPRSFGWTAVWLVKIVKMVNLVKMVFLVDRGLLGRQRSFWPSADQCPVDHLRVGHCPVCPWRRRE